MNEMLLRSKIGKMVYDAWMGSQLKRTKTQELRHVIDHVVQITDPGIRNAGRYRNTLQTPIENAMEYCSTLIEALPGPVVLNRSEYSSDPLVQHLFASVNELEEVLRLSQELEVLAKQGYAGEVTALLTMIRKERTVFGYERQGDMVQRDVAQRAVSFVEHEIVCAAATIDETKQRLIRRGLDVLATIAMEEIAGIKAKKAELRQEREYLNAMFKIMGGKTDVLEQVLAPPTPAKSQELAKVEARLAEVDADLDATQKLLDGPEDALAYLKTVVSRASEELTLSHYTLRLDWKGVRLDREDASAGNEISLAEFSVKNDDIHRSAVLVTFTIP
ncbi:MAG: hypothetical protein AB1568_15985 [Thermodesulfobacteriota bacterium]